MANWRINSGILGGYPHPSSIEDGYDWRLPFRFKHSQNLGFGLDTSIFNGYPHLRSTVIPNEWSLPFRHRINSIFGWQQNDEKLDNYPFVHFRILEPPPPPPPPLARIPTVELSAQGRYRGGETDVHVTLALEHVLEGDGITIQLYRGSTVHYDFTVSLSAGTTTFTHTIPANTFVGLTVGSFIIRVKISRDGTTMHEAAADYDVISAPTVAFVNVAPQSVQLPITTPITISSQWQVAAESINRVQGSASIGSLQSTTIDTDNHMFYANFVNVANLNHGQHSITINLTVTSNRYGVVVISSTQVNAFEVIPEPGITSISISHPGRYVGCETAITVNAGLESIRNSDSIIIRLRQGATIFHEHTGSPQANSNTYTHTIPQAIFEGLAVGVYMVQAVIVRDSSILNEAHTQYRAVATPIVRLLYVSPNTLQLPMTSPENINVTLQAVGEGINNISGTVSLDGTGFTNSVNTANVQFSVALVNVGGLPPRGYAVSANLTIISNSYGTVSLSETFGNALRVLAEIVPVHRNLRSNTVYIYNGFTLVHILQNYISLKWVRRYNRSGEFTLQLANTPENVALAKAGYIVAKDNEEEAGFIEDVVIGDSIEIRGGFISTMLSRRVANLTSEHLVHLQSTTDSLVRANFIDTSPDRIITGFRIANYDIASQFTLARIENGSIEQWLENQDVGFKVAFKPTEEAFEFSLYDGRRSAAVFTENFRNITDQQYFNQTARERNVVIVEGADEQQFTIGHAQGLERREAYARAGRFHPVEFGHQFLRQNEPTKSLDVKIVDPYTPFEYRQNYDIGDIVTIVSESYGVTITQNILEITEYYDKTGFHLYVVFGSIPRDLLMELRDNSHRIDDLWNHPEPPILDLEYLKELIIPPLVEEIFDIIEFPPLPEWLYPWENFRDLVTETSKEAVERKLLELLPNLLRDMLPAIVGEIGAHIVLDRLPTQAQIDSFPNGAVVHVYNPDVTFTPSE